MAAIHPYIHFNGNAEEAFLFYQSIFGGSFTKLVRFKDLSFEGAPDFTDEAEKIMHIVLPIGPHTQLMGSDTPAAMGTHSEQETRSKLVVFADSKDQANQFFQGLSEGATIEMPIQDSPWGTYFGMLRDRYGIEWMIEFEEN